MLCIRMNTPGGVGSHSTHIVQYAMESSHEELFPTANASNTQNEKRKFLCRFPVWVMLGSTSSTEYLGGENMTRHKEWYYCLVHYMPPHDILAATAHEDKRI